MNELMIFEQKNQAVVSSRIVAEKFGKRHDKLLHEIERMYNELIDIGCVKNGGDPLFFKSSYVHSQNNQTYKEYLMNRDGFSLLVMGFTGRKALEWKLKYIEAFNAMEKAILHRETAEWLETRRKGKLVRRAETDTLSLLLIYAIEQGSISYAKNPSLLYTNYSKLVNSAVGIGSGKREFADDKTLQTIAFIEDMILNFVVEEMQNGTYYKEIFKKCKTKSETIVKMAYLPQNSKQKMFAI